MRHAVSDCFSVGLLGACCIAACGGATHAETGETDASTVVPLDAGACLIEATNYDQSCAVDSDCISGIQSGNYCLSIDIGCGQETINKQALAQYMADVSKTPLGSGAIPEVESSCFFSGQPCCIARHCTPSTQCPEMPLVPPDAAPNGADDAAMPPGSFMCGRTRDRSTRGLTRADRGVGACRRRGAYRSTAGGLAALSSRRADSRPASPPKVQNGA